MDFAQTIKITEAIPTYADFTLGALSSEATALPSALIWQRIESYIAWRWVARDVTFIVQGHGEWLPPMTPTSITDIKIWREGDWVTDATTIEPGPLGTRFLCHAHYKVTATVGDDSEPPKGVHEAYRRLAEYFVADAGTAGASDERFSIGGLDVRVNRKPDWLGAALQNSGAADLLRRYRRA